MTDQQQPPKQPPKKNPVTEKEIKQATEDYLKSMNFNRDAIRKTQARSALSTVLSVTSLLAAAGVAGYLILGGEFFTDAEKARQEALNEVYMQYEQVKAQQAELMARQYAIENAVSQVRTQAEGLMRGDVNLINELKKLQTLTEQVSTVNARIDSLQQTASGQAFLDNSVMDLQGIVLGLDGRVDQLETALEEAKKENSELADVLEGVSGNDLKAAAMLLAASQLRTSLGQGGSFQSDLQTVRMLAGDDPELNAALDRLEPYSRNGILSTEGLRREFGGLAGEIIMAELQGEDVSWKDRAMKRLSNVVSVQKKGAEGDDTQAIVARAELMMNEGNIEGAIAELQKLQGPPADAAQPWIEQAQARLIASQSSSDIAQEIINLLGGRVRPANLGR